MERSRGAGTSKQSTFNSTERLKRASRLTSRSKSSSSATKSRKVPRKSKSKKREL
jgi:hypothetical protein